MNFKTTYILFGVLLVLLATLGVALFLEPVAPEASNYVLPSAHKKETELKSDDVTHVEIKRSRPSDETLVFERDADGKTWRITTPYTLRADSFAVNGLVRDILDAQRESTADVAPSLKEAGLDPPAEVITLGKPGREVTVNIGEVTAGGDNQAVFVSSSDLTKQGLPVKKTRLESVFKKLNDFRERTLLASSDFDIKAIKISEAKKPTVALVKQDEGRWKYLEPAYGAAEIEGEAPPVGSPPADKAPSGVRPLLNDLTALRVDANDDFVTDNVDDKDLAKYNLDPAKNAILHVEVEKSEGTKEEPKQGSRTILLIGVDKADNGKYFARIDGEKAVVKVAAKDVDPLRKLLDDPGAVRDRNLVRFEAAKTPDAIQVKNGAGTFELLRPDSTKPWQLYRGDTGTKADDKATSELVNLLTQKNIVRTFPAPKTDLASLGLEKPAAVVSLWVDGIAKDEEKKKDEKKEETRDDKKDAKKDEKKEEKKSGKPKLKVADKPTVRLSFGAVEGNLVAVKREADGETTLLKVPASIFDSVKNGPLAYMDRELPKFNEVDPSENVTKLVLIRNGVTTELTRDAKASTPAVAWKIDKPADLAGRTADANAVSAILRELNNVRAVKLVTDAAEPDALDHEYGLKTPAIKAAVTITKDGKSTEYTYEFGKEADATKLYARQGQRANLIIEVDKADLVPFSKDLRDPGIFHFDATKAKTLKLIGWKEITGTPTTLEFERKDASTWVAKTPKDYPVSNEKVNRLVNELSTERAVKFLDRKVTPKERDEAALSADKGGLVIEVTVEGEKEPFVLTVGNLDADKAAYLATANRSGDALFTVPKDIYEKPKEKPAFFSP